MDLRDGRLLKHKVNKLLSDVSSNVHQLELLGIQCARRDGTVDNLDQKKSIDLASKIAVRFIDLQYYESAFNIVAAVCNMKMGPYKSTLALVIADTFIVHRQFKFATNIALLLTPLKGAIKIKVAKQIAIKLRKKNQISYLNQIYGSLQNNPAEYAKKAAYQIINRSKVKTLDIHVLLKDVHSNLSQIESVGRQCAKRGGSADDLSQKKAIDLATKIGLILVQHGHYQSAFNIVSCLCNFSMGPFKSACAIAIATTLMSHKQYHYAKDIALLLTPLKGKLKIATVKDIALKLRKHKQSLFVTAIYDSLLKNPADYAQVAAADILNHSYKHQIPIDTLMSDVNKYLMPLEKIGIKSARRGGSVYDPEQKEAIDLATKIAVLFIEHNHFNSAFNIVKQVCNVSMGPFKSSCALAIVRAFIYHNQYQYAEKIALLITSLRGSIMIDTVYEIVKQLLKNNHINSSRAIYNAFKKNPDEYASIILNQIEHLISTQSKTGIVTEDSVFPEHTSSALSQDFVLQSINVDQLIVKASSFSLSSFKDSSFNQSYYNTMTDSLQIVTVLKDSFGSLIQENQQCVSWSNQSVTPSKMEPFTLTLTHDKLTFQIGTDYHKTIVCFHFKTGLCTRNNVNLMHVDIEKYVLIFFKIIENEGIYRNEFEIVY